jgi:hypothetical protein
VADRRRGGRLQTRRLNLKGDGGEREGRGGGQRDGCDHPVLERWAAISFIGVESAFVSFLACFKKVLMASLAFFSPSPPC